MTLALVLGGGGPLGLGWEVGLLEGLAESGIDLKRADAIIGTSAGSAVAAALSTGVDFGALLAAAARPFPLAEGQVVDLADMQSAVMAASAGYVDPMAALVAIGQFAASSTTTDESSFVGFELFDLFRSTTWPDPLRCTGINIETGALMVWSDVDNVNLALAIAASCAVPTVFPPVTVASGGRYMDGGMVSPTNPGLAAGHDTVLVISCYALTLPESLAESSMAASAAIQRAEIESLRADGAAVTVVEPDAAFLALSGWGAEALSVERVAPAYRLGGQLGRSLASRVQPDLGVEAAVRSLS